MQIQKSFDAAQGGTLYIVPTPIGNLEDITFRALKVLETAAAIAAEDTRHTRRLLTHFNIKVPLVSYHEHNKRAREAELISRLAAGENIALVSDAGMPGISDPGEALVQAAIAENLPVVVLPGANAALLALVGSGLPASEFTFIGFLPRKKKDKQTELERLKSQRATMVFYESPFRVKDTLQAIASVLGERQVVLARELTKRFEEYIRGTAQEVLEWADDEALKGEFCIVVEGADEADQQTAAEDWWASYEVKDHVQHYIDGEGMTSKEAVKQVAKDRHIPKRDVYQAYHVEG
ncbi:16S rRNA (cytidine(1402)-2'-O)-methyltransferase [Lentibacillus sp. JNUCC-1]|uniref:16S rRNA (cytidine(1402)-2'-O)-methyltransferase n=1 Tax=Lentibacillus sp. JNUCC-1 TaxID=2654513 RepID=UPI0012E70A7F|nr:16S rRNA (cytidine(1402)-2'-O)-methyltransferase [Lentibacillus sp. JNUCC-1]MUV38007.1 16S rRNA (cytidine(1402)-2'-O)-methyltransferase [Lentibacillus sp. JNUCC-1]